MIKILAVVLLVIMMLATAIEPALAQTPDRLDSLQKLLTRSKPDTNQVRLFLRISQEYRSRCQYVEDTIRFRSEKSVLKKHEFLYDSALAYAQQGANLSRRRHWPILLIESLLSMSKVLHEKGDKEKAIPYAEEALALSKALPDAHKIADALVLLGSVNENSAVNTAIAYYEQAIAMYKQQDDRVQAGFIMRRLADIYMKYISQNKAKQIHLEAVEMLKPLGTEKLIPSLRQLAKVCRALGDFKEALGYQLQCLRYYEGKMDSAGINYSMYNLAWTYRSLHDYQRSIYYFNKLIRIDSLSGDNLSAVGEKTTVIEMYLEQHNQKQAYRYATQVIDLVHEKLDPSAKAIAPKLAFSYSVVGEYEKAEYWYLRILPRYEGPPVNVGGLCFLYTKIGELYIMMKQYDKARYYLRKALALSEKRGEPTNAISIHSQLFKVDSTQGKLSTALWHYQQATLIKDSLFNETKNKQLEELQIQYDTEKKEQDLILKEQNIQLLTQDKQLQTKQLERDKLIRNVIIGGALLLLALLIAIYKRNRLKQRTNQELKANQRQLQTQHEALQVQQEVINHKNEELTQLVADKNVLLAGQDQLLTEKERLLREIHHRVKNNLQVVMSLLNSQAASLKDEVALSAIQESQHRIRAMALIHQRLYQSEGLARIQMRPYLQEILAYLHDSYSLSSPVHFRVQVDEIELDVTQGVPLGLFINEALTNAFKYAFPDGRSGTITLSLVRLANATYQLTIADNGVGLPVGFDPAKSRSLGMVLLHGFGGQLGGDFSLFNNHGLSITLVFGDEPFMSPVDNAARVLSKELLSTT